MQKEDAPIVGIVIGGGLQHCTSSSTPTRQAQSCTVPDWGAVLHTDPAFAGVALDEVCLAADLKTLLHTPHEWRYRLTPELLQHLLSGPEPIIDEAMRCVARHLLSLPDPETTATAHTLSLAEFTAHITTAAQVLYSASADRAAAGIDEPFTAAQWAVWRALAVVSPPCWPRKKEYRSVHCLSDVHSRAIYTQIVAAAAQRGGRVPPRIGVVTAASEDPFADADIHVSALRSAGAEAVYVPLSGGWRAALDAGATQWLDVCCEWYAHIGNETAHPHSVLRFPDHAAAQRELGRDQGAGMLSLLASLDGLFFAGGDQARHLQALMSWRPDEQRWQASPELTLIRQRFAQGRLLIAGTSAGNHIQGGGVWQGRAVPMIAGGDSYPALRHGFAVAHGASVECPTRPMLYPAGGLGTFPYGVLDSHFSQRCREGRLIRACLDTQTRYGFGIDENTALLVTQPNAQQEVHLHILGEYGVWVVDVAHTTRAAGGALEHIHTHYLHQGDGLWLDAHGKLHVALQGTPDTACAPPSQHLLDWPALQTYGSGRWAALCALMGQQQASCASGSTRHAQDPRSRQDAPMVRVRFTREADTQFVVHADRRVSYAHLRVALQTETAAMLPP